MNQTGALDWIVLDRDIPTPLHYQLQQCIKSAIDDGRLTPGDRLPSIREFSLACDISPTTVAQAFAQLSREGVVISRRSHGTVVARIKPATTEVVVQALFTKLPKEKEAFFYQIIDGLMMGYADPKRRITFSHYGTHIPSARELLEVCRARGADEMVIYRPKEDLIDVIRAVSRSIPTVTLFNNAERSMADCIYADPTAPLRTLLNEYILRGERKFVFICANQLIEEGYLSPYYLLLQEFRKTLASAGIEPDVRIIKHVDFGQERRESFQAAASLPSDSVILSGTPDVAEVAAQSGCNSQFISYTESAASLNRYKNVWDIIYMGLEQLSVKAVELLKIRKGAVKSPQRVESVLPYVYRKNM